ncbi:hypothetical protein [Streptomyces sp. NWU339]|uniref:hypothetical protein n=1 Tax=Streptomyces sp. NWU339 TaxID=2185284 RepID=UPI0015E8265C|nr:hypothetical protein [Streptomyces sp. NWU339]
MISTGYRWPLYDGGADDMSDPLSGTINSKIIPGRSANVTMPLPAMNARALSSMQVSLRSAYSVPLRSRSLRAHQLPRVWV